MAPIELGPEVEVLCCLTVVQAQLLSFGFVGRHRNNPESVSFGADCVVVARKSHDFLMGSFSAVALQEVDLSIQMYTSTKSLNTALLLRLVL